MIVISEFEQDNRKAVVLKQGDGYLVEMYENGTLRKMEEITGHTLWYVEDCAENWILKVIKE